MHFTYSTPNYKGYVVVQGLLDTSNLVFTAQEIIVARLASKIGSRENIDLEYGAKTGNDKAYLTQVLPEMNRILQRIKFQYGTQDNCVTDTIYQFTVTFQ